MYQDSSPEAQNDEWEAGRKSRNAGYILIAAKGGDTTTLSPKGLSNLRTFGAKAPSNLRTFPPEPSGHRPVKLQNPLQKGRGKPCPFCSLKAVMVE